MYGIYGSEIASIPERVMASFFRRLPLGAVASVGVLLALALGGCASPGSGSKTASTRDEVLQKSRAAADAMHRAQFDQARTLLDDVLLSLGGISAGDRSARQARGNFHEESAKNFRGEPYERVMAYFYRGILFWIDGEPDNARACFKSAQLQDTDAENGQYQADYVSLDYLDSLATAKLGGSAADAWERARKNARLGVPPAVDPKANVLVFFEMGTGPRKYAAGEHGEQLRFANGASRATRIRLNLAGQISDAPALDDLSWQATTRGGRVMDHVLKNKAVFKDSTENIGNVGILAGSALAIGGQGRNSVADEVGVGLLAAGLVSKLISAAVTPHADTRQWDNLPNLIGFTSLHAPPGPQKLTVEFLDPAGRVTLTRDAAFTVVPGGRDVVLFFSDHP